MRFPEMSTVEDAELPAQARFPGAKLPSGSSRLPGGTRWGSDRESNSESASVLDDESQCAVGSLSTPGNVKTRGLPESFVSVESGKVHVVGSALWSAGVHGLGASCGGSIVLGASVFPDDLLWALLVEPCKLG